MKKIYILAISFYFAVLGAQAFGAGDLQLRKSEIVDSIRRIPRMAGKIYDTRPDRPTRNELKVNIVPFRPIAKTTASAYASSNQSASQKLIQQPDQGRALNNVKVFPNPVTDHINISYSLNKDVNVTIKIMDVLGNEISTLLSQRLPAGEQNHSFTISSRLTSGYYFIRLIAGTETVIKRISVM